MENTTLINRQSEHLINTLFERYQILEVCRDSVIQSFFILRNSFACGKKLLVCGNGGSAADAAHIAGELMKGFLKKRPIPAGLKAKIKVRIKEEAEWLNLLQDCLPVIPLTTNSSLLTAILNDQADDLVFAQQVLGYGAVGDTLLAISTSGNSPNVTNAVILANALDIHTIGLTGSDGGKLRELCNVCIKVPAERVDQIQELHLPIYHTLCAMLEAEFFD